MHIALSPPRQHQALLVSEGEVEMLAIVVGSC